MRARTTIRPPEVPAERIGVVCVIGFVAVAHPAGAPVSELLQCVGPRVRLDGCEFSGDAIGLHCIPNSSFASQSPVLTSWPSDEHAVRVSMSSDRLRRRRALRSFRFDRTR